MMSSRQHRPRTLYCRGQLLIPAVLLGLAASASAAPPPNSCDQGNSGERLQCSFGNVLAQQQAAVDQLSDRPEIPSNQKEALKRSVERAQRANGRATPDDYRQLTRRSTAQCQILEISGDGIGDDDGVCKGNESCSEEIGDGIGNDDGVCAPTKGKKREVCVQLCDAEGVNANDDNFDDDPFQDSVARDLEEQLDDSTTQYEELNQQMAVQIARQAYVQALAADGDACAAVLDARTDFTLGLIASQGAVTLRGVAGQFSTICDMVVAGFNSRAACLVTETLAAMAEVIDDSLEYVSQDIDSDTMDATYACVQQLNAAAGETNAAIEEMQRMLDVMSQKMDNVESLLLTPQGQRPGFNK